MSEEKLKVQISDSLESVPREAWNILVGEGSPFLEYDWLRALETTGRVSSETGWMPQILTAWREGEPDRLVGAIPMYLKGNSQGEFVYDWAWADLAHRMGLDYYPKLIAAVPFSPVSANKLLVHPDLDAEARDGLLRAMVRVALGFARELGVSGLHFLFISQEEELLLEEEGLMIRHHFQYHWRNENYASFDDFLGRFRAKKRNKIRREIKKVSDSGVTLEALSGTDLTDELMSHLFSFYESTCNKFSWGRIYLNREFFERIRKTMPERMLMFLARDRSGEPVAGTFSLVKGDKMYGRYWGCHEDVQFLHFVACCYAPIQLAISRGIQRFEPGQGGHHKYRRGFNPARTSSAHWVADARMSSLLRQHLVGEREQVASEIDKLLEASPLKCAK